MSVSWHQQIKGGNKEIFINVGKHLFVNKRFYNVSLKEICDASNLSKVTFYKSFTSVDDLIFSIQEKIFSDFDCFLSKHSTAEGSGLFRLNAFLESIMEYSIKSPKDFQFIGFFDYIYRDDNADIALRCKYKEILASSFFINHLKYCLHLGVEDKSIKLKNSISVVVAFIIEVFMSMIQRISIKGSYLIKEHGIDINEIRMMTITSIIAYIS